jgi:hypothetical protein
MRSARSRAQRPLKSPKMMTIFFKWRQTGFGERKGRGSFSRARRQQHSSYQRVGSLYLPTGSPGGRYGTFGLYLSSVAVDGEPAQERERTGRGRQA